MDTAGSLTKVLKSRGRTPALRREAAIKRLRKLTNTEVSSRTNIVRLTVKMRDPLLAQRVTGRYLEFLSDFNLMTRQTRGAAERKFTGQRVDEVKEDLKRAEDRLQEFLQRNRSYANSPELTFQFDRLSRDVSMQQQIYTSLVQAYEQAKIEEVRDTPVITILDPPKVPVRPDSRHVVLKTILGLVLGGTFGVGLAFWREYVLSSSGSERTEVEEFVRLRASLFEDLRHPFRALSRGVARSKGPSSTADEMGH